MEAAYATDVPHLISPRIAGLFDRSFFLGDFFCPMRAKAFTDHPHLPILS
jgi:hypothetical protein